MRAMNYDSLNHKNSNAAHFLLATLEEEILALNTLKKFSS